MPNYDYECTSCNRTFEIFLPIKEVRSTQNCVDCLTPLRRLYSFTRTKEFQSYYDQQYRCEITSARQETRLMKKHGDIPTRDTPAYNKFKEQRKSALKKPVYSIGAR